MKVPLEIYKIKYKEVKELENEQAAELAGMLLKVCGLIFGLPLCSHKSLTIQAMGNCCGQEQFSSFVTRSLRHCSVWNKKT